MLSSVIAELELRATSPEDVENPVRVTIAKPRRSRDGVWRCRCELRGLPHIGYLARRRVLAAIDQAPATQRPGNIAVTMARPREDQLAGMRGDIAGEDAFQALALAMRFIHTALEDFTARGGRLFYPDGTEVNLGVYFPKTFQHPSLVI